MEPSPTGRQFNQELLEERMEYGSPVSVNLFFRPFFEYMQESGIAEHLTLAPISDARGLALTQNYDLLGDNKLLGKIQYAMDMELQPTSIKYQGAILVPDGNGGTCKTNTIIAWFHPKMNSKNHIEGPYSKEIPRVDPNYIDNPRTFIRKQ